MDDYKDSRIQDLEKENNDLWRTIQEIYTDREELECENEALKDALKNSQEESEEKDKKIDSLESEVEWFVKENPGLEELEKQMQEVVRENEWLRMNSAGEDTDSEATRSEAAIKEDIDAREDKIR